MGHENHMGFIYSDPIPDFRCNVCGKVLVSSDGKEINPGRVMHKDKEEIGAWAGIPFIKRKKTIVCLEHQAQFEDKGYYVAYWWGKDGMIHGIK